jgi:hypothetical protein
MKFLSILVLSGLSLIFISKSEAQYIEARSVILLDKIDKNIESISVKFQKPLEVVDTNLENYQLLLNSFTEFKNFDSQFIQSLILKIKNNDTLSGQELFILRKTMKTYYKINKKILDFVRVYDFGSTNLSKDFQNSENKIPMIKSHLIWLSGNLLVLDHLDSMHALLYNEIGVFRRIAKHVLLDKNSDSDGSAKTLNDLIKMSKDTVKMGESEKFSSHIHLVLGIVKDLKQVLIDESKALVLLETIVSNKTTIEIARGKTKFTLSDYTVVDSIINAFDNITNWLSQVFGNAIGSIRWRTGYLYKNKMALDNAKLNLSPMDVLFEKTPFSLTDTFIPGHFGHAAVYLGTKAQLEAIGMWNHPDIIPYHDEIISGKTILEAVRTGVRLTSIEEFLNIDELTIMTKVNGLQDPDLLIEEISSGMDQIGKKYDFNFDISTLDKIVCSELIYITFGNIHWPTLYRFGRPTITPDDLAEILFQKNTKFKIKTFMVATDIDKIAFVDRGYIANELNYELRAKDGSPSQNPQDQSNSYWKKETKCYNVSSKEANGTMLRKCSTTYKEFIYEERDTL